jgi:hypothetical protein
MSNTITYSVIVRNPNSWSASTGIHEELANCGHNHKTAEAAEACRAKLQRSWCLCGRTSASYAPCCGTPHNSTSARWYHAQVEASNAAEVHAAEYDHYKALDDERLAAEWEGGSL